MNRADQPPSQAHRPLVIEAVSTGGSDHDSDARVSSAPAPAVEGAIEGGRASGLVVRGHAGGWFTLAPALKHVTGDFFVRSQGTVYRLTNTSYDLPDPTTHSVLSSNYKKLAPGGPSGVRLEPPPSAIPEGTIRGPSTLVGNHDSDLQVGIDAPWITPPGSTVTATVKVTNAGPGDSGPTRTFFLPRPDTPSPTPAEAR